VSQPEKDNRSEISGKAKRILAPTATATGALSGVATFLDADSLTKGLYLVAGSVSIALLVIGVVLAILWYQRARIATLAVVAALAVGGGAGYLVGHAGTGTPTNASTPSTPPSSPSTPSSGPSSAEPSSGPSSIPPSSSPPAQVRVTFDKPQPDDPRIAKQSAVDLRGSVAGLPAGHKLFIVSRTGDGDFFVVKGNTVSDHASYAAATQDGSWVARDGGVGSADDEPGTVFDFIPVDADPACAVAMEMAGQNSKDHRIQAGQWPPSCQPVEQPTSVTLK
jgi:hypothetical protein